MKNREIILMFAFLSAFSIEADILAKPSSRQVRHTNGPPTTLPTKKSRNSAVKGYLFGAFAFKKISGKRQYYMVSKINRELKPVKSGNYTAIIDSGVDHRHPQVKMLRSKGLKIIEKNFTSKGMRDNIGHGTLVLLLALSGGVLKVFPSTVLVAKVADKNDPLSLDKVIKAILWIKSQKNVFIVNMSLGFTGPRSKFKKLCSVIRNTNKMFVVAAGNLGVNTIVYPAGCKNVKNLISVTNTAPTSGKGHIGASFPEVELEHQYYLRTAKSAIDIGKWKVARALLKKSLSGQSTYEARFLLAHVELHMRKASIALSMLNKILLTKKKYHLYVDVSLALYLLRRYRSSLHSILKAEKLKPSSHHISYIKALYLLRKKQYMLAKREFSKTISVVGKIQRIESRLYPHKKHIVNMNSLIEKELVLSTINLASCSPSAKNKRVIEDLLNKSSTEPFLAMLSMKLSYILYFFKHPNLRKRFSGLLILSAPEKSKAIQTNDVILLVNGKAIKKASDFREATKSGSAKKLYITLLRNGVMKSVAVKLSTLKACRIISVISFSCSSNKSKRKLEARVNMILTRRKYFRELKKMFKTHKLLTNRKTIDNNIYHELLMRKLQFLACSKNNALKVATIQYQVNRQAPNSMLATISNYFLLRMMNKSVYGRSIGHLALKNHKHSKIHKGDIVYRINGRRIRSNRQFRRFYIQKKVYVRVIRKNKSIKISIKGFLLRRKWLTFSLIHCKLK